MCVWPKLGWVGPILGDVARIRSGMGQIWAGSAEFRARSNAWGDFDPDRPKRGAACGFGPKATRAQPLDGLFLSNTCKPRFRLSVSAAFFFSAIRRPSPSGGVVLVGASDDNSGTVKRAIGSEGSLYHTEAQCCPVPNNQTRNRLSENRRTRPNNRLRVDAQGPGACAKNVQQVVRGHLVVGQPET